MGSIRAQSKGGFLVCNIKKIKPGKTKVLATIGWEHNEERWASKYHHKSLIHQSIKQYISLKQLIIAILIWKWSHIVINPQKMITLQQFSYLASFSLWFWFSSHEFTLNTIISIVFWPRPLSPRKWPLYAANLQRKICRWGNGKLKNDTEHISKIISDKHILFVF